MPILPRIRPSALVSKPIKQVGRACSSCPAPPPRSPGPVLIRLGERRSANNSMVFVSVTSHPVPAPPSRLAASLESSFSRTALHAFTRTSYTGSSEVASQCQGRSHPESQRHRPGTALLYTHQVSSPSAMVNTPSA
ncbi:hypothetical protein EW146_g538 [Bondarzewia mesenterica]|uniref:Uncharacterized protein n=1 Tax=Bondarzewia mesenterica TaxID=1095465 RepID=A0A4S4M6U1_9AGAM|nr:hypothetical protein EW146_g538 [Bondarzewia mesenterica]